MFKPSLTPQSQTETQEREKDQMASSSSFLLLAVLLALVSWQATASDPSPLQDFCVADMNSPGTIRFLITFSPNKFVEMNF